MYRDNAVGVVVPAYNEEAFVGEVIDSIPEFVDRIYAIDDGSTDGTWAEIGRRARGRPRLRADGNAELRGGRLVPVRHDTNRGVGAAIKTGYRRAYGDGMDVVAVIAGDGQMDPGALDRLLDPIVEGRADYAKGDRLSEPEYREGMPAFRLLGSVLLTLLTRVASGCWHLSDPQNGYTAISREALAAIDVDALYEDYGFCNDLLVRLAVHDLDVVDVPMPPSYGDEESAIRYRTLVPKLSALLVRRFGWRLRRTYWDGAGSDRPSVNTGRDPPTGRGD